MSKFIVTDHRAEVVLKSAHGSSTSIAGKFKPVRRIVELTSAQEALYAEALVEAIEAGVLIADRRSAP